METILPPANLKDFDRSDLKDKLYFNWNKFIKEAAQESKEFPAYFNPLETNRPIDPDVATPQWTGFPRTIKRKENNNIKLAASKIDEPIKMGEVDPLYDVSITTVFKEVETGREFTGPMYRPQDEYLEWVVVKNEEGKITEVLFTCEGPEYWNCLAEDEDLLIKLYNEILNTTEVKKEDLFFDKKVEFNSRNLGGWVIYEKGAYNPFNKWNMQGAIHLTQPANTLGAEINLARAATRLYGDDTLVTSDPQLVACGGYGGLNRMSDPNIGSAVNSAVRNGKLVGLRNPIGLYIQKIDGSAFSLSDGTPIDNIEEYFIVIRPHAEEVTDMIVRAIFKVPQGVLVQGRQATINDLMVDGNPIEYGGQIADKITITLYAQTADGAPQQELTACSYKACSDPKNPNLVIPIDPKGECPKPILVADNSDFKSPDIRPTSVENNLSSASRNKKQVTRAMF